MAFLRLLHIELKRSHIWLLAAMLLIGFSVTDMRELLWGEGGGVTWYWIGGTAARLTAVFPFGVAFASWYAGRSRRNHLQEVSSSTRWLGLGGHAVALASFLIVLTVLTALAFALVSQRIWQRSLEREGGPPPGAYPWMQIVVILVAFAAFVLWGYWLGHRFSSVLVPIVSASIMLLLLQVPLSVSNSVGSISPLAAIIPTGISHTMAPYIGDRVYLPLALWGIAWFSFIGLIPLQMLRNRRTSQKSALLQPAVASALAILLAFQVSSAFESAGTWHAKNRAQVCIEQSGINFCAPPGALSTSDLEEVAFHYEKLMPSWLPDSVVPKKMSVPIDFDQLPDDAVSMMSFQMAHNREPAGYMTAMIYVIQGEGVVDVQPSAAQLVIACAALLDAGYDCGRSYPTSEYQHVPSFSQSVEGQDLLTPLFEQGKQHTEREEMEILGQLENQQVLTKEKLDSFMALPDAEKEDWLEENWDDLSSGELTLDDLP